MWTQLMPSLLFVSVLSSAPPTLESRSRRAVTSGVEQDAPASLAQLSARLDDIQQSLAALAERQISMQQTLDVVSRQADTPCRAPDRVLGEPCRGDRDCSQLVADSTCSSAGRCTCRDGFQTVAGGVCRPYPRMGEECRSGRDCKNTTVYGICYHGMCLCTAGYYTPDNSTCLLDPLQKDLPIAVVTPIYRP